MAGKKKCYQFVKDTYQISNQEIDDLKKSAEKDDYLDSKIVFNYVEEHKDRFRSVNNETRGKQV